jgi:hypothetical protein
MIQSVSDDRQVTTVAEAKKSICTDLHRHKGTPKNCFFGIRLQFLNPHLQLVNSGLKILSALKIEFLGVPIK